MNNLKKQNKMVTRVINSIIGNVASIQDKLKNKLSKNAKSTTITKRFYKEQGLWYIDLPEFLEAGLGTRNNLLMVEGADTFLDMLSKGRRKKEVTIKFGSEPFEGYTNQLKKVRIGMNKELLDAIGHAPVDYGAYYKTVNEDHMLWLCPVTEYVFQGGYPKDIYIEVLG